MEEEYKTPKISKDYKFCVDCGAKISVRAEICPSCGIRQPLPVTAYSSPSSASTSSLVDWSNAWYLLPIFLGIFGGVIAWYNVKKADPKAAKIMLGLGVITSIVYVGLILLFFDF